MNIIFSLIADGVSTGSLYGMVALAIVFIYRSSAVINFAQAEIATFSTFVALALINYGVPYFISALLTLVFAFVLGFSLQVFIVKRISKKNESRFVMNEILVTIGFLAIFNSLSRYVFSDDVKAFPSAFSEGTIEFGPVIMSFNSIGVIAVCALFSCFVFLFFRYSRWGVALEGVSQNRFAASLKGIDVNLMLAMGWGGASLLGAVAGLLIAPTLFLHPNMMGPILLYAFASAVIGGLDSPYGAVLGGIIVGITENLAGTIPFIGSDLKQIAVFLLLVMVLWVRPRGFFGRKETRKV